jgi:molybdopterin-guanine dinucleotide biosynthesis protein
VGLTAAQAAEILDGTPNAVYRLISRGALAKPVKHQHRGLQVDDVERASLKRHRYGRPHSYWATETEAVGILGGKCPVEWWVWR